MDSQLFEELRKKLEQKKINLEGELNNIATRDKELNGDWDTKFPDFGPASLGALEQEGDEVEEYENRISIEHSLESSLLDVNRALESMAKGAYGTCEKCGKLIEEERLRAVPEAVTHVRCPIS